MDSIESILNDQCWCEATRLTCFLYQKRIYLLSREKEYWFVFFSKL